MSHCTLGELMIDVDVAGIQRVAGGPATRIEIRSTMPVPEVVDVVQSAHVSSDWYPVMVLPGGTEVYVVEEPTLTATGVVVGIEPSTYGNFEQTLQTWAAALHAAGLEGALEPYRPQPPPHIATAARTKTDNLVAAMVFRGEDGGVGGSREVPPSVRDDFLATALQWGQAHGGDIHVCHGLTSGRLQSERHVARFVRSALTISAPVSVHWSTDTGFRTIGWDHAGHAWVQVADHRPWTTRVNDLETVLKHCLPHLVYALIHVADADTQDWTDALNYYGATQHMPPGVGRKYVQVISNDEESAYVPDAYGSQLLGPRHLAHARDLSHWTLVPAGHLTWVRAANPADWFAGAPRDEVTQAARSDFGDAILRKEQYSAAWKRERDRTARTLP